MCRNVGPRRLGPFRAPFASAPWQRWQLAAWKIESPSVIIAGVTAEAAPPEPRRQSSRDVKLGAADGAGADVVVVVPPPELHAAVTAAATMNSVGRMKKL